MAKEKETLQSVLDRINKSVGAGSVYKYSDYTGVPAERLRTGSIGMDIITGGGWVVGQMNYISGWESSGKSTLCTYAIAETQRKGGVAAYIDHEYCFDKAYATSLGVDVDSMILAQPDCIEDGYQIALDLIESGQINTIIFDSIAAAIPRKELEGDVGDKTMAEKARLNAINFPKFCSHAKKNNVTLIFVNQLREKIGVMFGCLHADVLVNFVDGTSLPIKYVVDNKVEGNVWSLNEKTGTIEPKKIIGWHNNGKVQTKDDFISFKTSAIDSKGGVFGFTVTPNHKVFCNNSWVEAKDVKKGDKLTSKYVSRIDGILKDFLYGTLIGDCSLRRDVPNRAYLHFQDNENIPYMEWKVSKLTNYLEFSRKERKNGLICYISKTDHELGKVTKTLGDKNPLFMLAENFSWLSMALWIMDDGHLDLKSGHTRYKLSVKRLNKSGEDLDKIVELINTNCNTSCRNRNGEIIFNTQDSRLISSKIRGYVPECMQYKLLPIDRGMYVDFDIPINSVIKTDTVEVLEIESCTDRKFRQKGKYDITVEDNHNYMVGGVENGVIVHNSPITEPGGNSVKFYPSIKVEVAQSTKLKEGDDVAGNLVKATCKKNKTARPFKTCEYNIVYGLGIDRNAEVLHYGEKLGFIVRSGAWYSLSDGTKLGQGAAKVLEFLADNSDLTETIEANIYAEINNL